MIEKVYFISGHGDITPEEFKEHYADVIDEKIVEGNCYFVIGDYHGVDTLAQKYLKKKGAKATVYHMFEKPRNNAGFPTFGGFTTDEDRDANMTIVSDEDIAWVREGKENSGTAINLRRRKKLNG